MANIQAQSDIVVDTIEVGSITADYYNELDSTYLQYINGARSNLQTQIDDITSGPTINSNLAVNTLTTTSYINCGTNMASDTATITNGIGCTSITASGEIDCLLMKVNGTNIITAINGKQPTITSGTDLSIHNLSCNNESCVLLTTPAITLNGTDLTTTLNSKQNNIVSGTNLSMNDLTCHNVTCTTCTLNGADLSATLAAMDVTEVALGVSTTAVAADLVVLDATVAGVITDVAALDADVATLDDTVSTLDGKVSDLEDKTQHLTADGSNNYFGKSIHVQNNSGSDTIVLNSTAGTITTSSLIESSSGTSVFDSISVNNFLSGSGQFTWGGIGNGNTQAIYGSVIQLNALSIELNGICSGPNFYMNQANWLS